MNRIETIVKIDLCNSKAFSSQRERADPSIRTRALERLLGVSRNTFPYADKPYPDGSFYKADGDAVFYVIEKPSVALRAAIEFMQSWFHQSVPDFPDCRVFIDRGHVELVAVPGKTEMTGKAFENLSVFEKGQEPGHIYLTDTLLAHLDATMAKFRYLGEVAPCEGESFGVYVVDFDDPRTVKDSSLIHALFVAHPESEEARDRLFALFAVEYLLEHGVLRDERVLIDWAKNKGYPIPPQAHLLRVLKEAEAFEQTADGKFRVREKFKKEIGNSSPPALKRQCSEFRF